MRIGAVNYLNSKPLVFGMEKLAPDVRLSFDLPSRLADSLAAGRLDVALIPSVEFFRTPHCTIVSDACVAARGPVLSVKLYFRVPPADVCRVALDEGSRTSAALTQILLAELCGVRPQWETLPIGCGLDSTDADAVLVIGDRAIAGEAQSAKYGEKDTWIKNQRCQPSEHQVPSTQYQVPTERPESNNPTTFSSTQAAFQFYDVWDLGERWFDWTGLPFVFAMWIGRRDVPVAEIAPVLNAARDDGVRHARLIAAREAALLGVSNGLAIKYLCDNLHFTLGPKECTGLRSFYQLCVAHELAPAGLEETLDSYRGYGCAAR
jgi:chorismate dehydratase